MNEAKVEPALTAEEYVEAVTEAAWTFALWRSWEPQERAEDMLRWERALMDLADRIPALLPPRDA